MPDTRIAKMDSCHARQNDLRSMLIYECKHSRILCAHVVTLCLKSTRLEYGSEFSKMVKLQEAENQIVID
jgi:hypothetical protein